MSSCHRRWAVLLLVALCLAGCSRSAGPVHNADKSAKVVAVAGQGSLHRVTLSAEAVARLVIQTVPVRLEGVMSVPFAAVIYDPQGRSWAYAVTGERTYQRVPIVIDRIDGDTAVLRSGPGVGVLVVSAGGPELLGVEFGVGEE